MKKPASKIFEFKGHKYSSYDLLSYYVDYRVQDMFRNGEVTNLETGEIFDINDIKQHIHGLNKDIVNNLEHLSYYEKQKIKNYIEKDEREKKLLELEIKLNNDTINFEELKELLFRKDYNFGENYINISLIDNNFIKLNQNAVYPKEIRDCTLGKFLRLLGIVTYKNELKSTNHGNSKNISKAELMDFLGISNKNTFSSIFQEMEKFELLYRKQIKGKGFLIFINPYYANRGTELKIDNTQYYLFKNKLEDKLPKEVNKFFELSNSKVIFIEEKE